MNAYHNVVFSPCLSLLDGTRTKEGELRPQIEVIYDTEKQRGRFIDLLIYYLLLY